MNRGFFSFISEADAYSSSDKEWVVVLERYHRYWYDLVVNPHEVAEYFDSRQLIVDVLKKIKAGVESDLEKRFVYFICSRERVRFDTSKRPTFNRFTGKTKIHLLVGSRRAKKAIHCKFYSVPNGCFFKPAIDLADKYITITDESGKLLTSSIHDFLADIKSNLGLDSRVEYVGYTKNPEMRPTDGNHSGLSSTYIGCRMSLATV
ncbi:hypothetical protein [Pseudomonas viridiflava]|uniref:hypothetical protein n=1 Tax=Pseudomonas viridiflava TaxID=33069 RepID=UPI0013CE6653|nr:hypothetical protein [Pseudomonas viridiflava]